LLAQEIGSQFSTRIEGTCIKHRFGKCSIKMYDKHGIVLRRPPPTMCHSSSTTERWNTAQVPRPSPPRTRWPKHHGFDGLKFVASGHDAVIPIYAGDDGGAHA
jgi:hypothetical protein